MGKMGHVTAVSTSLGACLRGVLVQGRGGVPNPHSHTHQRTHLTPWGEFIQLPVDQTKPYCSHPGGGGGVDRALTLNCGAKYCKMEKGMHWKTYFRKNFMRMAAAEAGALENARCRKAHFELLRTPKQDKMPRSHHSVLPRPTRPVPRAGVGVRDRGHTRRRDGPGSDHGVLRRERQYCTRIDACA